MIKNDNRSHRGDHLETGSLPVPRGFCPLSADSWDDILLRPVLRGGGQRLSKLMGDERRYAALMVLLLDNVTLRTYLKSPI